MSDTEFVDGLRVYAPASMAPDYIIANVALDRDALTAWLAGRAPQLRIVIKRSKGGKYYAALDTYQRAAAPSDPEAKIAHTDRGKPAGVINDDIPF